MGSTGNQNPWTPFNGYKDCSLGICSVYCPQFCYFIFPPPPPSYRGDSSSPFSPLIIAIIGLLASAFLLVSYYTIVTKYCRRGPQNAPAEAEENHEDIVHDQWQAASSGLDEATIKTITVCKYQKDQGLIEGTECAVCLSEFQENESLRLLPKCSHAFHLPCIDTWLKSHSNCPLCRANVTALPPPQASSAVHVDSYEVERPNDLTLVVDDQETLDCMVVITLNDDDDQGILKRDSGNADETERRHDQACLVKQFRRSSSLGAFTSGHHLLISDHASKIEELDVDSQVEKHESWRDTASSSKGFPVSGDRLEKSNCMPIKRYNSTGRFMFIDHNKGKNSLLPH